MMNISLNLSNKLQKQIVETLQIIKNVADEMNFPLLLVGASARDLILSPHNISPPSATRDFDFGVVVKTWDEYENLKKHLIENHNFRQEPKIEHRLIAQETNIPVDFIPFGDIENPKGKITWRSEFEMNTLGFEEAFDNALETKLAKNLILKTVSPLGFVLLKIFAWNDRKSNKDSQDLWIIVKNYLDLGNEELLYSQNSDLLEDENFDLKIAGARILGRNLRRICSHQSSEMVCSILENDKILQKIGLEIHRFEARLDDNFDHVMKVLESLRQGFKETVN